jgi:hypothetical protein
VSGQITLYRALRCSYLRLIDQESFHPQNRAHFIAMSARLMREILEDYARQRRAANRDYTCKIALDEPSAFRKSVNLIYWL